MLQIHLFGHLRLLVDGRPYPLALLPKTAPLLAYLLLHRDTAVPRDYLAFRLWPDVSESEARANLRRHLHDLRRALPPAGDMPWVLSEGKTLQWNTAAPYWLDVAEFSTLCQDTGRLAEAILLYTGDLLTNLYEDWLVPERERLQALYFTALRRLVARERARGDLNQALSYARQLLSYDPLSEDVVRESMALRYAGGDRAGAMQLYQQFRERLSEELGAVPMPETTALYDAIAHNRPLPGDTPPVSASLPMDVRDPAVGDRQYSEPSDLQPGESAGSQRVVQPPPHNLPAQLTSFVGRQAELAQICRFLGEVDSSVRLLTITGPGGAGKTRLALEVSHWLHQHRPSQFPDGLFFIGLSAVAAPDLVLPTIADVLDLSGQPEHAPLDHLKSELRDRRLLLLLDNFEHLPEAAPQVADLLTAAPGLRLLVTSQAALHLYGEYEFPLPPLPLPDPAHLPPADELLNYAAVRLFVDRLQAVQPQFALTEANAATIAEICLCLEGMPLALELAAARGRLFTPAAMLAQLGQRLAFLTGQARNLPTRHQTLRATLDWSYHLLAPEEQALFAGLALFAGPFTLTAARSLFTGPSAVLSESYPDLTEMLLSLVDKNMLRAFPVEGVEEPRFRMLQTLREYGLEKLVQLETAGELSIAGIRRRYAAYYVELAEQARTGMRGDDSAAWIRRLRQEDNNLIAALEWLFTDDNKAQSGLMIAQILTATARFWSLQGRVRDLRRWIERALVYLPLLPPTLQVRLLNEAGNAAQNQGDYERAESCHQEALALARQLNDSTLTAHTLHFLAYAAGRQGQYDRSKVLFQESLALYRQLPEMTSLQLGTLLNNLAIVHKRLGEYEEAIALLSETLAMRRAVGDQFGLPSPLSNLGNLLVLQGNYTAAAVHLREALRLRQQFQDQMGMLYSLDQIGTLAAAQGQYAHAVTLHTAAGILSQALAVPRTADAQADYEHDMALARQHLGETEMAARQAVGAHMTLAEAVAYALQVTDPS